MSAYSGRDDDPVPVELVHGIAETFRAPGDGDLARHPHCGHDPGATHRKYSNRMFYAAGVCVFFPIVG